MRYVVFVLSLLLLIVMSVLSVIRWYDFKNNCGSYLKLAGDAPTIERAHDFLGKAVTYMETRTLTSGNSALLFRTPESDVGIWYQQTKGALETTTKILEKESAQPGSVAQLERDNALMKIRETVIDHGEKGIHITAPNHITVYPHQWAFTIGWLLALAGAVGAALRVYFTSD